mgnify:CR=1 FL=1
MAWTARALSRPLELRDPPRPCDAIVVLGSPLLPSGELSPVVRERVEDAVSLWRAGIAELIVMTGGAVRGAVEAPAMGRHAEALGVPASAIVIEHRSLSTADNARLTAEILRGRGGRRVWLVTQPFHLRRSRRLFRRHGLEAHGRALPTSIQYEDPRRALRWLGREYVAWAAQILRRRNR